MNEKSNKKLTPYAQELRRQMTKEEAYLWYDFLKNLSVVVKRQKVIGKYIVDFYIAKEKLVIESDGSQHYEAEHREADRERDADLAEMGITVLRYTNLDISRNFPGVCQDILSRL
ncbi:MAG: endonuclease domain-containing protein [Clostridia bacterium]|nr:endonuclease domain-containing protein [Clostridia bacterium]